jgi:type II secretory pathway pseudopilin PulG
MLGGKHSQNRQSKQLLGYTIIEVLIVLAVSGMMFVIAVNFINGKQGKAAFTQGTNELASQIQGVIEQVTNGQYSDIPLTCTSNGTTTSATANAAVSSNGTDNTNTGINSQCVFLGKILRFHSGDPLNYKVLSLAGARVPTTTTGSVSLADVAPVLINDLTRTQNIPQQLTVKSARATDVSGATSNVFNFGFAQGLGSIEAGSFASGAQNISMIYSTANMSPAGTPDTNINASNLTYAKAATICMTDGQRYAQILVGANANNASQLSVRTRVVPLC